MSDYIVEHGGNTLPSPAYKFACENDLEGIVAKPKNSPYIFSETETDWVKMKNPITAVWATCAIAVAETET